MAISCIWAQTITTTETLADGALASANSAVIHSAYNEGATIAAGTTPPATKIASFLLTLSSGAATIDLRDLVGTNAGAVDGNGLKVQLFRVKNLGANVMTFTFGASNPYNIFGASGVLEVPVGGVFMLYGADALPDIGSSAKEIDVAGTAAQTAEITVIMG